VESIKVLVIDDEEFIRVTLRGYLEDSGFMVEEAQDGDEGVERFSSFNPDAVLVDLQMPRMGGMEVIRKLAPLAPETPIIVVSGANDIHNALEAIRLGAWDYITKPIEDLDALGHSVQMALSRAELQRENREYRATLEERVHQRTQELEEANERLKASLREKVVLLKEIHHRVKNNLQIVSSLLALQSGTCDDPDVAAMFEISRNRINSMALLHEELYQSNDLARIDLKAYAEKLMLRLQRIFSPDEHVQRKTDIPEPIFLELDTAIPCGLIINELVTNAFKHAFPQGSRGSITLSLKREGKGMVRLTIADDGAAFPTGIDFRETETLGMQLVVNLVDQISGHVEMRSGNGTTFDITFPEQPES